MVNMDLLNEAELLQNLRKRYIMNKIYTYVGPTLLAVNPFKSVESLYSEQTLAHYINLVVSQEISDDTAASTTTTTTLLTTPRKQKKTQPPPHVYGITADAFVDLFLYGKNQALVISGESGAGKTENTKHCMKFLTSLGGLTAHAMKATAHGQPSIEDKVKELNPLTLTLSLDPKLQPNPGSFRQRENDSKR